MSPDTLSAPLTLNELQTRVQTYCQNHPIEKLEVFGSVARETTTKGSDIDLLATFSADLPLGFAYFDFVRQIQDELEDLLESKVDLLDRATIEDSRNPIRRHEILSHARVIYERVT